MVRKKVMNLDMERIPVRYAGKWVALSIKTNKVTVSGTSPKEVLKKLKKRPNVVITRVATKNYSYLL